MATGIRDVIDRFIRPLPVEPWRVFTILRRKENITLALALVGALTGLASLSTIVWERVKYPSRVEITWLSFYRSSFYPGMTGSSLELRVHVGCKNLGKLKISLSGYPMISMRRPDGKKFGPYLMRSAVRGAVSDPPPGQAVEPLSWCGGSYSVSGLERAIVSGELSDLPYRFEDFTFEVAIPTALPESGTTYVVRSFSGEQVDHQSL